MGKSKKSLFLGVRPIGGPAVKSRRVARKVTTQYHTLIQQRHAVEKSKLSKAEKEEKLREIDSKIEEIGGINKYQEASVISTRHFSTSKWIIQALKRLRPDWSSGSSSSSTKRQAFEVGAINTQLHSAQFLDVRSIDLHSQHALIEEKDFFLIPPERKYDVVVCSMVINYVEDPFRRAEMVGRLCMHLKSFDSVLFLILPRRCLTSPFFTDSSDFLSLLQEVFGLQLLEEPHYTPKVAFFTLSYSFREEHSNLSWMDAVKSTIDSKIHNLASLKQLTASKWVAMLQPDADSAAVSEPPLEGETSKTSADDFSICVGKTFFTKASAKLIRAATSKQVKTS